MNPTNLHREQAREIVSTHAKHSVVVRAEQLSDRIAEALSVRDAEVKQVLEGLLEFCDQVIEAFEIRPMPAHRITLQRARDLYSKLLAPELQGENPRSTFQE